MSTTTTQGGSITAEERARLTRKVDDGGLSKAEEYALLDALDAKDRALESESKARAAAEAEAERAWKAARHIEQTEKARATAAEAERDEWRSTAEQRRIRAEMAEREAVAMREEVEQLRELLRMMERVSWTVRDASKVCVCCWASVPPTLQANEIEHERGCPVPLVRDVLAHAALSGTAPAKGAA